MIHLLPLGKVISLIFNRFPNYYFKSALKYNKMAALTLESPCSREVEIKTEL